MTRLTEYHNGVAVIKGKRFKEAAEKLAWLETLFEQGLLAYPEPEKENCLKCIAFADVDECLFYGWQEDRHKKCKEHMEKLKGGGSDE